MYHGAHHTHARARISLVRTRARDGRVVGSVAARARALARTHMQRSRRHTYELARRPGCGKTARQRGWIVAEFPAVSAEDTVRLLHSFIVSVLLLVSEDLLGLAAVFCRAIFPEPRFVDWL